MSIRYSIDHLTELERAVTQDGATEPPFTGRYNRHSAPGEYSCVVCGLPLFGSESKFDAGCGWPSFDRPLPGHAPTEHEDSSFNMQRVEVRCPRCGAHLGHLFPDGPTETGLRYCINSAALHFEGGTAGCSEGTKPIDDAQ